EALRQQAVNRSGPNYLPEAEGRTEAGSKAEPVSETGRETGPTITEKAKEKLSAANESLKESVTRTQENLSEAMSGGIQQKASKAWGKTKAAVTPDENQPSMMDRLTTSIAEGSKKLTETAQNVKESMKEGVKTTLGLGEAGNEPPQTTLAEEAIAGEPRRPA
ncbi:hypothetical protein BVRB_043070, partial [Beta vulgaris subsp. vulgaris]